MKLIINAALLGLVCTLVVGLTPTLGGFSPVGPEDTDDVNACMDKVTKDLETQESGANDGYTVAVSPSDTTAMKQVVAGINYKLKFSAVMKYTCKEATNCVEKVDVTKTCSATLNKPLDQTQPLTYVQNQGLSCDIQS